MIYKTLHRKLEISEHVDIRFIAHDEFL